jgi:signal transduction histidine kinase
MGAFFAVAFFFHFIIRYLELNKKSLVLLVYFAAFTFSFFNWYNKSRYFLGDIHFVFEQFYWIDALKYKNPLFFIFYISFFWIALGYSFFLLLNALKNSTGATYNKLRYFIIAVGFGWIGTNPLFLPAFHVNFYPYSNFLVATYPLLVAYAIVRHQVMDIDIIIKKTLVFAGLFVATYAVIAIFAYLGSVMFESVTDNRWAAVIPFVLIIVLMLHPLENFLRKITDKYLFQKKYDYKKLLKTFTDEVITVLDLNKLVNLTVDNLADIMKLENATILLRDGENEEYRIVAAAGLEDAEYELPYSEEMVSRMKDSGEYVRFENSSAGKNADADIRRNMLDLQAVLAIPLMHQNNMVGILSLGKKKSDEEFAQDDIDILLPLAKTLSIAITNAQLFEKLSEAQAQAAQREKMAVIGTLSAGINHEICNPLGIARGQCEMFLLNLKEGIYKDKTPEELLEKARDIMEKVINETDRATVITRKLSSFAKPSSGIMSDDVNVEKELNEVISLVEHDLKLDNITVTKEISEGLPLIVADRKQLQEILFNIIRNAAQAIKDRGRILIRATSSNDKVYIDIEDTGSGMSKSHLAQIFNPFFTTKEPGKGTGLGLFIVKQIVERNRGRIAVKSDPGKGTTFYLRFDASRADDLKKGHGVRAEKG